MPELNEDILTESNSDMLNQTEDSGSLDESALHNDENISPSIDPSQEKLEDSKFKYFLLFLINIT